MSSKQELPIEVLSVVLAVLKLTMAGYWSWWMVMLLFLLAFLGHNFGPPVRSVEEQG